MIFFKNCPRINCDYVAPDGTKIHVDFQVAECDPPIYTYFMKIGDNELHKIAWKEIYPIMHDTYGIPNEQIPDKYKPEHLITKIESVEPHTEYKRYGGNYTAADGTIINIDFTVAESCPAQYFFRYKINNGPSISIKQWEIFTLLTEKYGIDPSEVEHYVKH